MAFDEWMLGKADSTAQMCVIRLYSWREGTITFGYNQNQLTAYDTNAVGATPVIRRITGGRALYHDINELTYSIAAHNSFLEENHINGSISIVAGHINDVLVTFLTDMGIESQVMRSSAHNSRSRDFFQKAPCFASYSRNEIMSFSSKVIASAQRRSKNAVLQHGSIKINGIMEHPALYFEKSNGNDYKKLGELNKAVFASCAESFLKCFKTAWHIPLDSVEQLSHSELTAVENLIETVKNNRCNRREIIKQSVG